MNKCSRKIPIRIDPDATVIAPRTIRVILVINRRRDRPELPLNFFILNFLQIRISREATSFSRNKILRHLEVLGYLYNVCVLLSLFQEVFLGPIKLKNNSLS